MTVGRFLAMWSLMAVAMTLNGIGRESWTEILEHYALWRGELWPIVLAWLGVTPWIWARRGASR